MTEGAWSKRQAEIFCFNTMGIYVSIVLTLEVLRIIRIAKSSLQSLCVYAKSSLQKVLLYQNYTSSGSNGHMPDSPPDAFPESLSHGIPHTPSKW